MCLFDTGAREGTRGECEGCVGSIDCGTCFQKQRGNHHHVQFCTAVKLAMLRVCLFKSVEHFFPVRKCFNIYGDRNEAALKSCWQ